MNEIVNKFLTAGDKPMSEMHFRQPRFTYSAYRPFIKNKDRMEKFKEAGDLQYISQNELGKACFHLPWFIEILKIYLKNGFW